jgi:hypothetical protein
LLVAPEGGDPQRYGRLIGRVPVPNLLVDVFTDLPPRHPAVDQDLWTVTRVISSVEQRGCQGDYVEPLPRVDRASAKFQPDVVT